MCNVCVCAFFVVPLNLCFAFFCYYSYYSFYCKRFSFRAHFHIIIFVLKTVFTFCTLNCISPSFFINTICRQFHVNFFFFLPDRYLYRYTRIVYMYGENWITEIRFILSLPPNENRNKNPTIAKTGLNNTYRTIIIVVCVRFVQMKLELKN